MRFSNLFCCYNIMINSRKPAFIIPPPPPPPPPHNEVVGGVYWFHSVRPSVRPSVTCPSRIPCPLCSFFSSGWIHFIFIHLIKQLQKVCRVQSFLQNFKIWCESLVWVIMGRQGVSQNAGVLVVLVLFNHNIYIFALISLSGKFLIIVAQWLEHVNERLWVWEPSGMSCFPSHKMCNVLSTFLLLWKMDAFAWLIIGSDDYTDLLWWNYINN